jgi:hypothetical protein
MTRMLPRLLYAASAAIFAFGSFAHAAVFFLKAGAGIGASNLSPLLQSELKGLWLCDSTTLAALAAVFFYLAARPQAANRTLVILVALVPAGTTLVLYVFMGAFYAAHMLLAATAMAITANLLGPARELSAEPA